MKILVSLAATRCQFGLLVLKEGTLESDNKAWGNAAHFLSLSAFPGCRNWLPCCVEEQKMIVRREKERERGVISKLVYLCKCRGTGSALLQLTGQERRRGANTGEVLC